MDRWRILAIASVMVCAHLTGCTAPGAHSPGCCTGSTYQSYPLSGPMGVAPGPGTATVGPGTANPTYGSPQNTGEFTDAPPFQP